MKVITPSLFLLASLTLPRLAIADPHDPPAREVRVEVIDPGDPAGGADVTTTVVGERGCTSQALDDGAGVHRKLEICIDGPMVELHLERHAAGKVVDARFAARAKDGERVRLGKLALGGKQTLEAYVTAAPP